MDRRRPDRGVPIAPALPPPRTPGHYAIGLVCLGNICRSPTADVVLAQRVDDVGLAGRVTVSSCGTGDWHVGQPMDERAAAVLRAHDYDPSQHRAQQLSESWLDNHDLVLAMDRTNVRDIGVVDHQADPGRIRLFRDFDPVEPGGDVPDPYYGGADGFEEVLAMVERTCAALVSALQRLPGLDDAVA
ncbi:MAG TPA: low molecular weight protein-tyrosine-phosphatase [Nocardioides sp.]|nr:low molecular weight protein-tyrosine-phosphatase [Nocardioides sp.]